MIGYLIALLIYDMIKANSTQYVWLVIGLLIVEIILSKISYAIKKAEQIQKVTQFFEKLEKIIEKM